MSSLLANIFLLLLSFNALLRACPAAQGLRTPSIISRSFKKLVTYVAHIPRGGKWLRNVNYA